MSSLHNEYKSILDELNKSFDTNKTKSYEWRVKQLKSLSRLMTENEAQIEEALANDLGRCKFEAISLETLGINMEILEVLKSGNLDEWMKTNYTSLPAMMAPATSEYVYEPYGVVLIISAFNYPIALTVSIIIYIYY
jgi:aldehyde dehydrogenase (NAD+)